MKAGKVVSLCLLLILTVLGTAVVAAITWFGLPGLNSPGSRIGIAAALMAVAFSIVLIPFGLAVDRAIRRVGGYIEGATREDEAHNRSIGGSAWLSPITRAITGAVDRFEQREKSLKNEIRDLEIRHRVSEAERRQIKAVLHSLRDGVLVTDAFGDVGMANEAAARILDFELEGATHQPIDRIVANERLRSLIDDTRDLANFNDRRHVELEVEDDEEDQPSRVYDISLTCVPNHKQDVGGVVTIMHDITREREVSQMKSDFVSKASHELRTPLSSIRAYVEMLVDGEAPDEESRQEFYQIIQGETERLGRLIDNMLNISRIEAGIVQIERESVDIKSLVERTLETLEPQARERKISLHKRLAPVDLHVEGDPDMLYQVILNIVSNAVKYTPEGGRVSVGADSDNLTRSVVVTISDTGLGIPPDAVPRLFEKFYRVESYKRVAKGTGLGLSLCKHIVETVHHGQIGVESKLGMGSKFWFSVPMQYAGSRAAA